MYRGRCSHHVDVLIKIIIITFMVPYYPPNHSLSPSCFMFAWIALFPLVDAAVEFHKVTFRGGATYLDIDVEKSESNPQRLLFDTGSTHTYLLNHKMLLGVPRAYRPGVPGLKPKGYRKSLISPGSLVPADAHVVDFAGFEGLILEKWTSKKFTLGSYSWLQKFAVAHLPLDRQEKHDPRDSGLIGASPDSEFTKIFPKFGFIARDTDKATSFTQFFLSSGIDKKWCLNEYVGYAPLVDEEYWLLNGGLRFGDTRVAIDFKFLIDSGTGLISIPEPYYSPIERSLEAHGVVWNDSTLGMILCNQVHQLPPIHIETESGFTISILPEFYSEFLLYDYCLINIKKKEININWVTVGHPLVKYLVTEFDKVNNRIGFCEPPMSSRGNVGTPLVRRTVAGETFQQTRRVIYTSGPGDVDVLEEPPRIPSNHHPADEYNHHLPKVDHPRVPSSVHLGDGYNHDLPKVDHPRVPSSVHPGVGYDYRLPRRLPPLKSFAQPDGVIPTKPIADDVQQPAESSAKEEIAFSAEILSQFTIACITLIIILII